MQIVKMSATTFTINLVRGALNFFSLNVKIMVEPSKMLKYCQKFSLLLSGERRDQVILYEKN